MRHVSVTRALTAGFAFALLWGGFGCGGDPRPPPFKTHEPDAEAMNDEDDAIIRIETEPETGCPPAVDQEGYCGNQVIPIVKSRPNLYFVLDRSGSMADLLEGSRFSKYDNAYLSVMGLLQTIGHRIQYGAALFPAGPSVDTQCDAGGEVFPLVVGDSACYEKAEQDGPHLNSFRAVLGRVQPQGGTPLAATLERLLEPLSGLPGETAIVLCTDGGPNCNAEAECSADRCIPSLEQQSISTDEGIVSCDDSFNCCDPGVTGQGSNLNCVDAAGSESAVAALAAAGVRTYVIGMPGSEAYAEVLEALAVAGQTARQASPRYYAVADTTELGATLFTIGSEVAIDCEIELDSAPPDPRLVNVYADADVLPLDEQNGWSFAGDREIAIHGQACEKLKSGAVLELQVVAGCPTFIH